VRGRRSDDHRAPILPVSAEAVESSILPERIGFRIHVDGVQAHTALGVRAIEFRERPRVIAERLTEQGHGIRIHVLEATTGREPVQ